jgi:hypothetical protein
VKERIKRPEPERTAPVRNWGTVFGPPGRTTPPGVGGAPPSGARDPVSRGVEAGYRVIDEYLRQGQAAARAVWAPFIPGGQAGPAPWSPWTGGAAGGPGHAPPLPDEMQQRMGTMLRYATDLAMMWMDFIGMGAPGGAAARTPGAGPFTAGSEVIAPPPPAAAPRAEPMREAAASDQATVITLEVASMRPVEVSVDLRPRSAGLALKVHDLRAPEVEARLGGITITGLPDEDRVIVRLRVADDLPAGVYSGLILDERTSLPRGTLSVRVAAA